MKRNHNLPCAFLGIFAAVAVTGHAATIAYVGEHYNFEDQADDPAVGWRNTTTTKLLDIDGDHIYGTDGYLITSGLTSLPSYISSVNKIAINSNSNSSFGLMDNPASPSGTDNVNFGVWHRPDNGNILDFTITGSDLTGQTLRVAFFFDTYNNSSSQTYTLTQTVGGSGVANSAVLTGTNGPMDAAFFDLTNVSAGDVFVLSSVGTSGLRHTGGITFDTVVTIPEPSAALLGSLGLLAILRRRRN